MIIEKKLLKWWLIFCLTALGFSVAYYFNIHTLLFYADVTKLSFLIIVIFIFTSVWIGRKTYDLETHNVVDKSIDVGWFIAEACLALGMVGTVTGFLYMLGTAFENIDISNVQTLQDALASMALGMSTALYTTLTGLIASLIIKIQLVNYEVYDKNLTVE
jgi:hypothetical protein|tara:strand:- start:587 stop:1066 length:480 start_codon:yes stop_codon:yes gene_type:complete